MKSKQPTNSPTLKCGACGASLKPYEKWVNDDQGRIFCVHVDAWPEYFLDQNDQRIELCGPVCGLKYLGRPLPQGLTQSPSADNL